MESPGGLRAGSRHDGPTGEDPAAVESDPVVEPSSVGHEARERALRFLDFLEAYHLLRSPPLRDIAEYKDVQIIEADIPVDAPGICLSPGEQVRMEQQFVHPSARCQWPGLRTTKRLCHAGKCRADTHRLGEGGLDGLGSDTGVKTLQSHLTRSGGESERCSFRS